MQRGAVIARGADARVAAVAKAGHVVAVEAEERLDLVLGHAGPNAAHDLDVRVAADLAHVPHQRDLLGRLEDAALDQVLEDELLVDGVLLEAGKRRRHERLAAVAVDAAQHVNRERGAGAGKERVELVDEAALVDLVVRAPLGRRQNLAHPHGVRVGQPRQKERAAATIDVEHAVPVGLLDAKQVLKERLLAEQRLVVRVVAVLHLTCTAPQRHSATQRNATQKNAHRTTNTTHDTRHDGGDVSRARARAAGLRMAYSNRLAAGPSNSWQCWRAPSDR